MCFRLKYMRYKVQMADFIMSVAVCIYAWWIHNNSRFQKFVKSCIVSIIAAWAAATFLMSLSELAFGFMLACKLQTAEWVNAMSNEVSICIFWIFVVVLGIGVYLGIRALLMDVIRGTQRGYRDTFGLKPSTEERLDRLEDSIATVIRELKNR